jgi:hypothetical protein
MIARNHLSAHSSNLDSWQEGFLEMLPRIKHHAHMALRHLAPEERAEALQEVTVSTMIAYRSLVELDKVDIAYPTVLARYAVARYKVGRRVGSHLNCHDVMSPYARHKHRIRVGHFWQCARCEGGWHEMLVENKSAGPAEVASYRIDFAAWFAGLTPRQRTISNLLVDGETVTSIAKQFGVTRGRVSQIRRELRDSWKKFHHLPNPASCQNR